MLNYGTYQARRWCYYTESRVIGLASAWHVASTSHFHIDCSRNRQGTSDCRCELPAEPTPTDLISTVGTLPQSTTITSQQGVAMALIHRLHAYRLGWDLADDKHRLAGNQKVRNIRTILLLVVRHVSAIFSLIHALTLLKKMYVRAAWRLYMKYFTRLGLQKIGRIGLAVMLNWYCDFDLCG
jgi:hypothetical protein